MTEPEARFLRVHEVADLFGISVATTWRHVSAGILPQPVRLGRVTRWDRADLEAAITRAKAREAA
ncbi:helix-turn-helix domain-containing protein [Limibaculum sp. M0105]|uniref:Helix-turn-helix domain-containing protein n=1 Tax=Thermohalobaculum xanthum TaxID=2753746 RepID=A0A8J7SC71_9RHOB|nr:helix-turn-helix domain-containing protein [Thermohalobaculum xanthum]